MAHHSTSSSPDTYIPYGRGGAGNMRRKSSIRAAWFNLSSSPTTQTPSPTSLNSSPEDYYAASKTSAPRRRSSTWSTSTSGGEHLSKWRRLSAVFSRRRSSGGDGEWGEGKKADDEGEVREERVAEKEREAGGQ